MAETETQPFYNVMPDMSGKPIPPRPESAEKPEEVLAPEPVIAAPKIETPAAPVPQAPIITPTLNPTISGPTATNFTIPARKSGGMFSRKTILIPVFIVILAAAGFATWFISSMLKDDNANTNANNTPVVEQVGDPDVTTPADWLARFFGSETCTNKTTCGDSADPDRDGLANKEEYDKGTDPNNPDIDNDGIADGDEFHIFNTDPLLSRTYREGDYNDADFIKGGYDIQTNTRYTDDQLLAVKSKVKDKGLHQPTLTTIGTLSLSLYDFTDPDASSLDPSIDQSAQAKLDRDTNRQANIKKIGAALLKYKAEKKTFPATSDFNAMVEGIKPYVTVATDYADPINSQQYIYGYTGSAQDFTLSYFSETQNQLIKYSTKEAIDNDLKENSAKKNEQRITDLENIKSALLVYSSMQVSSQSDKLYIFPTMVQYPQVLVDNHLITTVPKDPDGASYVYTVSDNFESFTLKAQFQNPPKGVTGYVCNEIECKNY